jgi:hypothetical protein
MLGLCPLSSIAWRFIRLISILTLALSSAVLAGFWTGTSSAVSGWVMWGAVPAMAAAVLLVLFLAPFTERSAVCTSWVRSLALAGGLCGILAGLGSIPQLVQPGPSAVRILAGTGHVLGAVLLASVNLGWLLGHRYLTAPGMSIDPLRRVTALLAAVLAARGVFLIFTVTLAWMNGDQAMQTRLALDWLMVAVRVVVGLVLPAILVGMAWQCVRLRSTQSATGILFFASVLVAIGELTSQQLALLWRVPI